MHRIEGANNIDGEFTEGPPGTIVTAAWLNAVQNEIINVITEAGLSLGVEGSDTEEQLFQAISALGAIPPGAIVPFGGAATPAGWLACNGTAVSRTTYANLFGNIGETWGSGDGLTTFNTPDLEGAFLRGIGDHNSETMADGNPFSGPALGAFENDKFQAWQMGVEEDATGSRDYYGISGGRDKQAPNQVSVNQTISYFTTTGQGDSKMIKAMNDGTYGDPRKGDETNPFNAGVKFIIKV